MHERLREAAFSRRVTQSAIMRQALDAWLRDNADNGKAPRQP
jgi:hypothetical protein